MALAVAAIVAIGVAGGVATVLAPGDTTGPDAEALAVDRAALVAWIDAEYAAVRESADPPELPIAAPESAETPPLTEQVAGVESAPVADAAAPADTPAPERQPASGPGEGRRRAHKE